jgi:hypothetical protein
MTSLNTPVGSRPIALCTYFLFSIIFNKQVLPKVIASNTV